MRGGLTIEGVVQMSFKRTESYPRERSPSLLTVVIVIVAIITLLDKLMTAINRIFSKFVNIEETLVRHRRVRRELIATRGHLKTEKVQAKSRTGTLASDRTAF
jgi:hypothetical protein